MSDSQWLVLADKHRQICNLLAKALTLKSVAVQAAMPISSADNLYHVYLSCCSSCESHHEIAHVQISSLSDNPVI